MDHDEIKDELSSHLSEYEKMVSQYRSGLGGIDIKTKFQRR